MALQISEPGMSPEPHEGRLAVGIDLGTTNSLVATVRSGMPVVLPDAHGRPLLPSIVRYLPMAVEVGYAAQARQADDPKNTIVSVKRFMGRGMKDVAHIESAPYDFVDAPGMLQIRTAAGVKSPVEISAEILKVLGSVRSCPCRCNFRSGHHRARLLRRRTARRPRTPGASPA